MITLVILMSLTNLQLQGQGVSLSTSLDEWYDGQVSIENAPLIDGIEYLPRLIGKVSDPFYSRRKPFEGSIHYRGQNYTNVSFIYDIYQDILVLSHNQNNQLPILMEIDQQEVKFFELEGRRFETLIIEDSTETGVGSGYFEILASSPDNRFVSKRIKEDYLLNARREFHDRHRYFIQDGNGTLIPIRRKGDFLKLFGHITAEIKQFVKRERLKIKPWNEEDLLQLYLFCEPTRL